MNSVRFVQLERSHCRIPIYREPRQKTGGPARYAFWRVNHPLGAKQESQVANEIYHTVCSILLVRSLMQEGRVAYSDGF
jgi:hypothetical protein